MPAAITETVIGLFFVFLLMSMVSSQIVEWIAGLSHWRAQELEKTLRSMLNDPGVKAKLDSDALVLTDMIYAHPLIDSLAPANKKPSYIPAGKFALALFDVIMTAGTYNSSIGRARLGLEQVKIYLLASLPTASEQELLDLIQQIQTLVDDARAHGHSDEAIANFSLPPQLNNQLKNFLTKYKISPQVFNALIQTMTPNGEMQMAQIRTGVGQLANLRPELSQLITSLFTSLDAYAGKGESQLSTARRNVEQWFDEAMERAGGWYKRNIQLTLAIIGLILAILLNVDAINIANALWSDPTLRENVVQQAQKYQLSDNTKITNPDEAAQAIRDLNANLGKDLGFPIGWRLTAYSLQPNETCSLLPLQSGDIWGIYTAQGCMQLSDALPSPITSPLEKLLGFGIMAVAVSQGAPFWFDLLSKLVNMRGSGSVPQKSGDKQG